MKKIKSLKVLLIADNKLNDEVLTRLIQANGKVEELTLHTIHEADKVLDEIRRSAVKPHLVIISEPVQGSIKFAAEMPLCIHSIKNISPAIEVIVLSTFSNLKAAIETFHAGAYDVVLQDEHVTRNIANAIHRFIDHLEESAVVKMQNELITSIYY